VTQSGKPSDKLELAFRLYDIDRNGSIDQQEMADIIQVVLPPPFKSVPALPCEKQVVNYTTLQHS